MSYFLGFPHDHKLIKQDKNHVLILNFVYRDNHYLTEILNLILDHRFPILEIRSLQESCINESSQESKLATVC